jgi:dTDP-4-amino-4,6-dideoxygalactose transaminase
MIPFNVPPCVGDELDYVKQAIDSHKICGDGAFTKQCNAWLEERFHAQKVLLTTSGTTALDMAMLLCDIHPGDEVILPSYTFSSTATAAVLAGAKLVFVDIRPDTMNIDETKIEQAITDKTRVIIAMHYAGVACEMDTIMDIARRHDLKVVEDAAQGVMSNNFMRRKAPVLNEQGIPTGEQREEIIDLRSGRPLEAPSIPPGAIAELRQNPKLAEKFDETFGPGAASQYLR